MSDRPIPPFGQLVEFTTRFAAAQMHLFAEALGRARDIHGALSNAPADGAGIGVESGQERKTVVEIERDGRVGIDLKFGTITFKKDATGDYALALVDVIIAAAPNAGPQGATRQDAGTRVQMELKVPAAPESESIVAVTEKCRLQIVATLRAAAARFDATTATALVFHEPPGS